MSYDAFISYSHAADGLLAPRLQDGLQRFAKPWWRRRALHVFRDESRWNSHHHRHDRRLSTATVEPSGETCIVFGVVGSSRSMYLNGRLGQRAWLRRMCRECSWSVVRRASRLSANMVAATLARPVAVNAHPKHVVAEGAALSDSNVSHPIPSSPTQDAVPTDEVEVVRSPQVDSIVSTARPRVPTKVVKVAVLVGAGLILAAGIVFVRSRGQSNAAVSHISGVSVAFSASDPGASSSALDQAAKVLRTRLNASLQQSEAMVLVSGSSITVDILRPSNADISALIAGLGSSARLQIRPTCSIQPLPVDLPDSTYTQALDSAVSGACVTPLAGPKQSTPTEGSTASSESASHHCGTAGDQAKNASDDQPIIAAEDINGDGTVDDCEVLGPVALSGEAVDNAQAAIPAGAWVIELNLKQSGLDAFNTLSGHCFNNDITCPSGRTAIVLDGQIQSNPRPQTPTFTSPQIDISGRFDEQKAKTLAAELTSGALPIALRQQAVTAVDFSVTGSLPGDGASGIAIEVSGIDTAHSDAAVRAAKSLKPSTLVVTTTATTTQPTVTLIEFGLSDHNHFTAAVLQAADITRDQAAILEVTTR
jgi:hypothetical protein